MRSPNSRTDAAQRPALAQTFLSAQDSVGRKCPPQENLDPLIAPTTASDVLNQAQRYLTHGQTGPPAGHDLEAVWLEFYEQYARKIRKYAFTCGADDDDIADCVQDVWAELLVRLPTFRLDSARGKFDSWLFHIVRGKTADLHRSHRRRPLQEKTAALQNVADDHPSPDGIVEEIETFALVCAQLKQRLSGCNYQILQMRLVEERPVAEVADELGLTHEQVWYRYHRARREAEQIGAEWSRGNHAPLSDDDPPQGKNDENQKSAQGNGASSVSRFVFPSSRAHQGGNCVDYVFQRLELGRRELTPEWKVEWNCDGDSPRPVLYIRKMAIVAYAEICGSGDFINAHWPRIVNAAITAGVAAGIATIIATPTAALPVFQGEFHKHLQGKGTGAIEAKIQVALSAKQEANGPWYVCKE